MKSFIILCAISVGIVASANPLIRFLGEDNKCKATGPTCLSCSERVTCIKEGDNYIEINKQTCPTGSTCLAGSCISIANPGCDYTNLDFPCQYQGAYPHPGDWTKYVFCVKEETGTYTAYVQNCEDGAAYDPLTTYCNKDVKNINPSTFPVQPCVSESQLPEALEGNPTIYMYCAPYSADNKILYPFLRACPKGGIYQNGECQINLKITN
ncbi:hypothetical protein WA026_001270 [Henosepilachna vigintioctopunctata]|uniref:Chitin-binding type-2 domain-containing protein n=1 Tax=Henosepilachna vigintioctopunctata TaxID=420089 RepID=A0AAW1UPW8_9CUCU